LRFCCAGPVKGAQRRSEPLTAWEKTRSVMRCKAGLCLAPHANAVGVGVAWVVRESALTDGEARPQATKERVL
jgi:hypothetical protein